MMMSVSLNHPFVEKMQDASTQLAVTTVCVKKGSNQLTISHKRIVLNAKTSMNVWIKTLIVVLMQNAKILKEVISAHVKLATLPAMGKRYLLLDKEFNVLTEMNAPIPVLVE